LRSQKEVKGEGTNHVVPGAQREDNFDRTIGGRNTRKRRVGRLRGKRAKVTGGVEGN